ncbi:hypothetical protein BJF85_13820 [Saccharomonospora sp. CUA-673]|uniref:ATP dependent DNA ligase n=1 Tax=Saccharomonospora sp. CUA-673 TaxID=1904969 RepID=UPI0009604BED|nr:hypothetical protein BJF85_13820 [Saccharomonospora sp. CUA-673]
MGRRARARADRDGRCTLFSRRGGDITATYPELSGLGGPNGLGGLGGAGAPDVRAWLDGEIVALSGGVPSFAALQRRMHAGGARAEQLAAQLPVTYVVFDLLHLDSNGASSDDGDHSGGSLLALPYEQRRRLLEELAPDGPHCMLSPRFDDGAAVVAAAAQQRLEGVVAKRLASPYREASRSTDWVKISERHTIEVVIGGWRPGEGRRAGTLGSLLLGRPDPAVDGLRYVGQVGSGFSEAMLTDLSARLSGIRSENSPFGTDIPRERAKGAHWVRPHMVGEVEFKAWTEDGRLRAPSWRGLRPDRTPDELAAQETRP